MKKICLFLTSMALVMSSFTANAQLGNSEKLFDAAEVSLSPVTLNINAMGITLKYNFTAVNASWYQARTITPDLPVFLQYGAGLQYTMGNMDFMDEDAPTNLLTVKVPVNVVYDFAVPNTELSVLPYAGLNLQGHILGSSDGYSLFDEDEMGMAFNRISLGWQIGAKVAYDKYFFGIGYEGPVTSLFKEDGMTVKLSQVNISVGMKF